jgi:predicted alpha/beta hydrolase family esterase
MKKAYIIHGWDGYPEEGWFPWLKKELETRGFEVVVPQMPDAANPRIKKWVPKLREVAGIPDENTYFIGHSMGCQTIARYLESLPENVKIGGVVFVAGFFTELTNLEDDETVRDIAKEWLTTPLDLQKVKNHFEKSAAIFSDTDKFVPLINIKAFEEVFGAEIHIEHAKGHFSGPSDNCFELPVALEALLKIAQ